MKLEMYGVKDNVEGGFVLFFQAVNEGIMKRIAKGSMLSKEANMFTTNLKDKSIYLLGKIDIDTGAIEPLTPLFMVNLSSLRLELIQEIKQAKQEEGIENPDASEVVDDE